VCNDAVAILFMFDLSRKSTLNSVKEWYRQARGFNKACFDLMLIALSSLTLFLSPDRNTFPHRHQV
jgi:GTPase SAR1 family protein